MGICVIAEPTNNTKPLCVCMWFQLWYSNIPQSVTIFIFFWSVSFASYDQVSPVGLECARQTSQHISYSMQKYAKSARWTLTICEYNGMTLEIWRHRKHCFKFNYKNFCTNIKFIQAKKWKSTIQLPFPKKVRLWQGIRRICCCLISTTQTAPVDRKVFAKSHNNTRESKKERGGKG